ncbi:nucleotidyltransferase family protein [Endothiovibrio diazotrophicus]
MQIADRSIPPHAIAAFCHRWKVTEMSLFGSVLREDFGDDSDVDVLLDFSSEAHWSLFDLVDMKEELSTLFERPVDVVTRRGLEASRNHLLRQEILTTARTIHRDAA